MRITRSTASAFGLQMLIVGVFGAASALAQVPAPPVTAALAERAAGNPAAAARADDTTSVQSNTVRLLVGRSTLVDVGVPVARVSLTSADVADALVTSPSQLLVHGKVPGAISMFVWDRAGAVKRYEIAVQRDLTRLAEQMKELFPGEAIQVHSNGKHVVLSGNVSSKAVVDGAVNVAAGHVERREDVVALLQVQATRSNQVLLRVRFAEVSRNALTELGASFFTSPTGIENNIGRVGTQQFGAPTFEDLKWTQENGDFGARVTSADGKINFGDLLNLFLFNQRYDMGLMIRALQNRGLFQSLAEPNLVAESGKEASFLAGGEIPIPIAQGSGANLAISVQYKEFGVRLNFTPTVNGDRVHLKVRPEVSTLDYANAVTLNGFRIPALTTRRTETELELRNGQTFAIAGLMNNQMNATMQKIPGIGDIPILGYLFRSKAAQKNQTELVVMITPEILPLDGPGVTNQLPRYPDTFMDPVPADRARPVPPPAFTPQSRSQADAAPPVLTADERKAMERAAQQQARDEKERSEQQARDEKAQAEQQARDDKARAEQARVAEAAAKKQAEEDARTQKKADELAAKQAREQAKKDAEAAERAQKEAERAQKEEVKRAEAARKQQEKLDREQAELARRSSR